MVGSVVERIKEREAAGWSYEAADASFELLLRDALGETTEPFTVESYRVIIDRREDGDLVSEATVKLEAGASGSSPPRRATVRSTRSTGRCARRSSGCIRSWRKMELIDYKVRIMAGKHGTDAVTRVLIETSDRRARVDHGRRARNVIEASWLALHDAVRYGLLGSARPL